MGDNGICKCTCICQSSGVKSAMTAMT
jgi:hypothetical protein